jgi:hypothetical protein
MDDSLTQPPLTPAELIRELRENPTGLPKRPAMPPRPVAAEMPAAEEGGPESYDPAVRVYKAFGVSTTSVPAIRFIFKDGKERVCYYAHLDSRYPDGGEFIPSAPGREGNILKLRFAGHDTAFTVVIEGRNLRPGWERIQAHQTPWVAEYPADTDAEGDEAAVVKSIWFEVAK